MLARPEREWRELMPMFRTFWMLITLQISDGTLTCLRTRALPDRQEGLSGKGSQGMLSLTLLVRLALNRGSYHRQSKTLRGVCDGFPDGREPGTSKSDWRDEVRDMLAVYPH